MLSTKLVLQLLLAVSGISLATAAPAKEYRMQPRVMVRPAHLEVLRLRASTEINPHAVTDVQCLDRSKRIVFHDENVAELDICGGIAGSVSKCGGSPASTTGRSGTAEFVLRAVEKGAAINVSKARWEGCVRAARAVCPTGSISATCVGAASTGDVAFTLDNPRDVVDL